MQKVYSKQQRKREVKAVQLGLGKCAFANCSVSAITIPNSVTSIGYFAFRDCSSLTSITIPDSVTEIGSFAFAYCYSLTSIIFQGTKEEWEAIEKDLWCFDGIAKDFTVQCTDGKLDKNGKEIE